MPVLSQKAIRKQIVAGNRAARKLVQVILRPGIKSSEEGRHIPIFRADSKMPNLVVRVLDGVTDRGKFNKIELPPSLGAASGHGTVEERNDSDKLKLAYAIK